MPKAPRRKKPKRERINPDKFKNAQRPKDVVLPRFELQNLFQVPLWDPPNALNFEALNLACCIASLLRRLCNKNSLPS